MPRVFDSLTTHQTTMTNEPEITSVEVEEPTVGLSLQFIIAMMLTEGITEVIIPKKMLDQAMDRVFQTEVLEDGGFVVRLLR